MLDGKSSEPPVNLRLKFGILVLLCVQNAGHALLARFSNVRLIKYFGTTPFLCLLQSILKESYSTTEVVFVAEVMKVFASAFLMFSDKADSGKDVILVLLVSANIPCRCCWIGNIKNALVASKLNKNNSLGRILCNGQYLSILCSCQSRCCGLHSHASGRKT